MENEIILEKDKLARLKQNEYCEELGISEFKFNSLMAKQFKNKTRKDVQNEYILEQYLQEIEKNGKITRMELAEKLGVTIFAVNSAVKGWTRKKAIKNINIKELVSLGKSNYCKKYGIASKTFDELFYEEYKDRTVDEVKKEFVLNYATAKIEKGVHFTRDSLSQELGCATSLVNTAIKSLGYNTRRGKFTANHEYILPDYKYDSESTQKTISKLTTESSFYDVAYAFMLTKTRSIKESSYITYANDLMVNILPVVANVKINEYDQIVHDELLEVRNRKGASARSLGDTSILAIQILKWAKNNGIFQSAIPESKVQNNISNGRLSMKNKEVEIYSDEEIALLKKSKHKYALIVFVLLETGMRIGEVAGLQWDDIDFKKRLIYVTRQRQRLSLNGSSRLELVPLKSKAAIRKIPISEFLLEKLLEKKPEDGDGILIFNTEVRTLRYRATAVIKAAGVKPRKVHAFRHTFATNLIRKSDNYKAISQVLGHSSINITFDTYVHTNEDELFDLI